MGRSHVTPIMQPDEVTCGPAAVKLALEIFGKRKSLENLARICKTNQRYGTSTKNIIKAFNKLGFSVLVVEYATLHHLQSALKHSPTKLRAVLVSHMYDEKDTDGHWSVVSSYSSSKSRIILLDSYTSQKKSYSWSRFRELWYDYDMKRKKANADDERQFKLVKRWQNQLLLVVAKKPEQLPKFRIATSQVFNPPKKNTPSSVSEVVFTPHPSMVAQANGFATL